jgi:site-specific DNA-methyltransferase (adenine-specific)
VITASDTRKPAASSTSWPGVRIVVLTGFASIATAVEAIKLGACHYLPKPANTDDIEKRKPTKENSTVGSLPKGMKFDPQQGVRFQEFMNQVSDQVFRVLKPGGFFISFSQARLYHRMTIAVEDQGFEIRDMIGWTYQGQAKAFSQDHIIDLQKNLTADEKQQLKDQLRGWKTPQLKPCIEPMCLAQKPPEGKYIDNWQKWGVGLMNTNAQWLDQFPGNIIPCSKPTVKEKGDFNDHVSVKPVELCSHLIKLYTQPGQTVLDPFLGSGTTMVAAEITGRNSIGFELSTKYLEIIKKRHARVTMNTLAE